MRARKPEAVPDLPQQLVRAITCHLVLCASCLPAAGSTCVPVPLPASGDQPGQPALLRAVQELVEADSAALGVQHPATVQARSALAQLTSELGRPVRAL